MFSKPTLFLFVALASVPVSANPFSFLEAGISDVNSTDSPCASYERGIKEAMHNIDWFNLTDNEPHVQKIWQLCRDEKECFQKEHNAEMLKRCEIWSPVHTEFFICFRKVTLTPGFGKECPEPKDFDEKDCKTMFQVFDCAKEDMRKSCPPSVMEHWDETIAFIKSLSECH